MRLQLGRLGVVSALVLASMVARPSVASAESDSFGLGDGHSLAKTVVGDEEINSYAALTADTTAGVTAALSISALAAPTMPLVAAPFAAGDLVLVWRATGVAESAAPSGADARLALATTPGTTSGANVPGLVGQYEFARVQSVASGSLTLTKPLVHAYTKLVTQVVRVPEYTTVTIPAGASIRASAWQEIGGVPAAPNPANPWAGGIVIFMATGAITNGGTIHANARGFHGGIPVQRAINVALATCDNTSLDGNPETASFAPKGEGVVHTRYLATSGGKGNVSMAGGGGNCLEAGGGGGANLGNGGAGSGSLANLGVGGEGGAGVDYDVLSRLSMGGGGGAGRHISAAVSVASFGGFGGGVVYVRGSSMAGNGRVQANGGDGENSGLAGLPPSVVSEGSGGGGAGGSIVLRLTGSLDCDVLGTPGGNGGDAQVIGAGVFGAGGGGGGGRVFFQATTKTGGCDVVVTPGAPGNNGGGGAQPGNPGATQPPTAGPGPFCFATTAGTPGTCADPKPICDTTTGECQPCTGPFGGGTARACPVNVEPVCLATGACVDCNGDFGTNTSQACQLSGSPTCFTTGGAAVAGSCGKCTGNGDCTGAGHAGPICNVATGTCGTGCTTDADCKATELCATGAGGNVCIPKTPNGQPVPAVTPVNGPPTNGDCTLQNGQRVCLSAVCEEVDDRCGKLNSSPCATALECRSAICFNTDKKCGLPNGEPCTGNDNCRSDLCQGSVCTGKPCVTDPDCPQNQLCDATTSTCVDGCRPSQQDAGAHGLCPAGTTCVAPAGAAIGSCLPNGDGGAPDGGASGLPDAGFGGYGGDGGDGGAGAFDGGDTAGLIEGGGCSCNTALGSATSPLSALSALASVVFLLRRRKRSSSQDRG